MEILNNKWKYRFQKYHRIFLWTGATRHNLTHYQDAFRRKYLITAEEFENDVTLEGFWMTTQFRISRFTSSDLRLRHKTVHFRLGLKNIINPSQNAPPDFLQYPDVVTINLDRKIRNRYKSEHLFDEDGIQMALPHPCICYERYTNTLVAFCEYFRLYRWWWRWTTLSPT